MLLFVKDLEIRGFVYDIPNDLEKSIGLPEQVDPNHTYVYRSGEHGIYNYWWKDIQGNYWKYTNAPEDSVDFDPLAGNALINPDQPMPHTTPTFYTEDGTKRNVAVPNGIVAELNTSYDIADPRNIWFEKYTDPNGITRYTYKDTDVKENLDLWVQQLLRIADTSLVPYRQYAGKMFMSDNQKDKTFAVILMLADQGYYDPYELINATLDDLEFTDLTVNLLGRKFLCDLAFVEYLAELKQNRDSTSPLFTIPTKSGENIITPRHLFSIFAGLKMPPQQLLALHANQIFSRIVHRMLSEAVPVDDVEELAFMELARVFSTTDDVKHLVDYQVKDVLMASYAEKQLQNEAEEAEIAAATMEQPVVKGLNHAPGDDFGVAFVYSTLVNRRPDEEEFSTWLHAQPFHDISPEEQEELQDQLSAASDVDLTDGENPGDDAKLGEDQEAPPDMGESAVRGGDKLDNPEDGGGVREPTEPSESGV